MVVVVVSVYHLRPHPHSSVPGRQIEIYAVQRRKPETKTTLTCGVKSRAGLFILQAPMFLK